MQEPLVSFIIPVFNRETALPETVQSITGSNIDNYEIILVDDASTDNSLTVCETMSQILPLVKTIHRAQNGGIGAARNTGFKAATGCFVHFCDSDDKLDSLVLPKIFDKLRQNSDIDFLTANHVDIAPNGSHIVSLVNIEGRYSTDELLKRSQGLFHTSIWRSFYRRFFLLENNLFFYEGRTAEEWNFNSMAYLYAKTVYAMHDVFYLYYIHSAANSVIDTRSVRQLSEGIDNCMLKIEQFSRKHIISSIKRKCIDYFVYASIIQLFCSMNVNELNSNIYSGIAMDCRRTLDWDLYKQYGSIGSAVYLWNSILWHLKNASENKKEIYLCPAGLITAPLADKLLQMGIKITGFLDNNVSPENYHIADTKNTMHTPVMNFSILEKNNLKDYFLLVLGSINTARAITSQIEKIGMEYSKQFINFIG